MRPKCRGIYLIVNNVNNQQTEYIKGTTHLYRFGLNQVNTHTLHICIRYRYMFFLTQYNVYLR